MTIQHYIPPDPLKPFIKTFMIIESHEERNNHILPDTSLVMAFRFKGMISSMAGGNENKLPGAVITGIRKHSRIMNYQKNTASLLVLFKEGAAGSFIKQPLHELFETSVSLDHFFRSGQLHKMEDQLFSKKDHAKRIAVVEQFLLSSLKENSGDTLVFHAIQHIKSANGAIKMKDLANSLYISPDAFEKRFRKTIGTTPKQFTKIIRLRSLIKHYDNSKSLTENSLDAGYFDQAHFIKDFKSFSGQAPKVFFRSPTFW